MNRTMKKTALLSAVAFSAVFVAQSASAVLITDWDYEVNSAFTDFTQTAGAGGVAGSGDNPVITAPNDTTLSWGDQAGDTPSSISITSQVVSPPLLETNGGSELGATFTHTNNVIPAGSSVLDTFMLNTRLDLTANTPPTGDMQQVGPITFSSFFTETFNDIANPSNCVGGSTPPCDDIFVLSNADGINALNQGQSFTLDDFTYTVFLDLENLGPLTDAQCAAADADPGCIGFLTQEQTVNTFDARFRIISEQVAVPEPGSLALLALGLGLVGYGYARRRS